MNRILCTFTLEEYLDEIIQEIQSRQELIPGSKLFVLTGDQEELIVTYNADLSKVEVFPKNTILVHRRKQTNTLYTINALNLLIQKLNGGVSNRYFTVPWEDYRNSLLLIRESELRKIETRVHKIYSSNM